MMGLFEHWPYANFHDLNLDWIISKVKNIDDNVSAAAASAESASGSADASAASAEESAESAANSATSAENSELSAQASAQSALDVPALRAYVDSLSARIDSFEALTEGSTTGDAELQDIRVTYDGMTMPTAGDSVRDQVRDLREDTETANVIHGYISRSTNGGNYHTLPIKAYRYYAFNVESISDLSTFTNIRAYGMDGSLTLRECTGNYIFTAPGSYILYATQNADRVRVYANLTGSCEIQYSIYEMSEAEILKDHLNIIDNSVQPFIYSMDVSRQIENARVYFDVNKYKGYNVVFNMLKYTGNNFNQISLRYVNANEESVPLFTSSSYGMPVKVYVPADAVELYLIIGRTEAEYCSTTFKLLRLDGSGSIAEELNTTVVNANSNYIFRNIWQIFKKVVCCGDSYTSGHIYDSDGNAHSTNEAYAWPFYLEKESGNEFINCGSSGANSITWQTASRGLTKARSSGTADAYIVGIGINDGAVGTDRYVQVGTASDIGTDASTYYAQLSKIVRELNSISPDAFIFINTNPNTAYPTRDYTDYNTAVRTIAEMYAEQYHTVLVDLDAQYESIFKGATLKRAFNRNHPTAIGQQMIAEAYSFAWADVIMNNRNLFIDVPFD